MSNVSIQVPTEPAAVVGRPGRRKKKQRHKSRMITGYIIYASEIRKEVIKKCPDRDFGYISKIVGLEWKNLSTETKLSYEKRAQKQNEKTKAMMLQQSSLPPTLSPQTSASQFPSSSPSSSIATPLPPLLQQTIPPPTLIYQNGPQSQPPQFMSNNIVYRKPTTVRLKPRDIGTQTMPIEWVPPPPAKEPLRFSQTFINYLNSHKLSKDKNNGQVQLD